MRAVELMYLLTVVHNRNAYLAPVVASGDETNVNHILQLVHVRFWPVFLTIRDFQVWCHNPMLPVCSPESGLQPALL